MTWRSDWLLHRFRMVEQRQQSRIHSIDCIPSTLRAGVLKAGQLLLGACLELPAQMDAYAFFLTLTHFPEKRIRVVMIRRSFLGDDTGK